MDILFGKYTGVVDIGGDLRRCKQTGGTMEISQLFQLWSIRASMKIRGGHGWLVYSNTEPASIDLRRDCSCCVAYLLAGSILKFSS